MIKNVKKFKRDLWGHEFLVVHQGNKIRGYLANEQYENKIINSASLPFKLDLDDYIVLIRDKDGKASLLLIDDIQSIQLISDSFVRG